IPLPNAGVQPTRDDFLAAIGTPEIGAPRLQEMLESAFGRVASRDLKTGANSSEFCQDSLYCDNRRGVNYAWRSTYGKGAVDCDFGECPSTAERRSSPWLETRRQAQGGADTQDYLEVNADLEVLIGTEDKNDCPFGDPICDYPNGTDYDWYADVGINVTLEPVCVDGPNNSHSIRLAVREVELNIEDGNLLVGIAETAIDTLCQLWGHVSDSEACSLSGFLSGTLDDEIENALASETFLDDLDACPEPIVANISEHGGIELLVPPPENGTGRSMPSDQWVRWARVLAAPGASRDVFESNAGVGIANVSITTPVPTAVVNAITGADSPTQKQSMGRLNRAQAGICALLAQYEDDQDDDGEPETYFVCDPALDLNDVPLPPPSVSSVDAFSCDSSIPSGTNDDNDKACEMLSLLKSFVMQPEIYEHCVLYNAGDAPPDLALPTIWELFEDVVTTCEDSLPSIETLIPVPSIELEIETGRYPGSDTFAFVDFSEAGSVKISDHEEFSCRNRLNVVLDPDPEEYEKCTDLEGSAGFAGCPCKDVDVFKFEDILVDGGFPDGPGSFLSHPQGNGQFCHDEGSEVVCGRVEKASRNYPKCMECGVDTALGCSCETTSECQGFEDNLRCVGSASEEGWPGGGPGTCLPDPGTGDGREELEEMPWFCLDNCEAIDGYGGQAAAACYYRGVNGLQAQHGTCVQLVFSCLEGIEGVCEIENGHMCKDGGAGPDVCEPECVADSDCPALGFPANYVCDSEWFSPAHCVPPECHGPFL
ncbi:MAG: hypothetical protein AAFQ82_15790, partial [Myxococcota bacterium]